jgi:hypothetical protein
MDANFILQIVGVIAAVVSGINFVLVGLAKVFWKFTFETQKQELLKLKEEFEIDREKNTKFRHEYKGVTKNLWQHIENEIKLISVKIEGMQKVFIKLESVVDKLADSIEQLKINTKQK